jgi:2',3'-cyclic-nucleotide 2'-phosphodiesterase (5'-nucleotidase family)
MAGGNTGGFRLQILHASDQEAGVPALQDAIGLSAVMNALDGRFANTLKLTSGDLFIAGPFFDASRDLYDRPDGEGGFVAAGQPGIADILIQNELGWHVAAIGNHEFDAGADSFLAQIAANPEIMNGTVGGQGIGPEGYPGALFPYLSANLDLGAAALPAGLSVVEGGGAPLPNTLTSSVVANVNGEPIGVLGAVTPYLPTIANIGPVGMLTGDGIAATTAIEEQVAALIANLAPEVQALTDAGIDKIVLMTHLQEAEIEQALAQALVDQEIPVDVLMGGGSHRVMASGDGVPPLREDETQQDSGQLLQPYPQEFGDGDDTLLYVNTGSNYRYLSQLVVGFGRDGEIVKVNPKSATFATDIAGVDRLYKRHVEDLDDVRAVADPELVQIVDGVGAFVNALDADIFGQIDVFLNGIRGDVRTQETNLGNLTADANIFYAEQYLAEHGDALLLGSDQIDVSFKNGGGIRDIIGQSFVAGGGGELIQLPPAANPNVGKEEGDISRLDISNSLRFNNDLAVGTVTAEGLHQLAEHMVSGIEIISGRFGQIGGMAFSFDPTAPARTDTLPGERIQNLALVKDDGSIREVIVQDSALVADPAKTYSVVTLSFLATDLGAGVGRDSYPLVLDNVVSLADFAEPATLGQAELAAGGEQDALAEFLAANHNEDAGLPAFTAADTAQAEDQRIQNLDARDDTILAGIGDFIV